eukprot:evm.model.NODE_2219_length_28325_cov_37.384148.2
MVLIGLGGDNGVHDAAGAPPSAAAAVGAVAGAPPVGAPGAVVLPMPGGGAADLHVVLPDEGDFDDWLEEGEGEMIGEEEEEEPEEEEDMR